jgi:hypothetical protein
MSYKGRMEPGAYDGLRTELRNRMDRAISQIESHARNGTLDQIRYHAGLRDGLATAMMVLEGRDAEWVSSKHGAP